MRFIACGVAVCLGLAGCAPQPPITAESALGFRHCRGDGPDTYLEYLAYRATGPVAYDYVVVTYGRPTGLTRAGDLRVAVDGTDVAVPAGPGVYAVGPDRGSTRSP